MYFYIYGIEFAPISNKRREIVKAPKILIVDNERSVRQALCFELEDAGYDVIHASDYQEAMDLYHISGADMVITDIFLVIMTGNRTLPVSISPRHFRHLMVL